MPYLSNEDPGWQKVQQALSDALGPFAEALGPRECQHGDWSDCEASEGAGCPFDETRPKQGLPVIDQWVLVASVVDATRSDPIIASASSPQLRNHEVKGLLHVALYE